VDSKTDKIKGRVEVAVGVLTNDQRHRNRGKIDRAALEASDAIEQVIDKATRAAKELSNK
jgi:uncharacterized protein YjbJ (UPF0337 family)